MKTVLDRAIIEVMARVAALGVAAFIALLSAGAGSSGTADVTRYFRVTAMRYTAEWVTHKPLPGSAANGDYFRRTRMTMVGIAVWNGYSLHLIRIGPGGADLAVVSGDVAVQDQRTASRGGPYCASFGGNNFLQGRITDATWSNGRFDQDSARLHGGPGAQPNVKLGCTESETLTNHGVDGSLSFDVPGPSKRSLNTGGQWSYMCADDYSHETHDHTFSGVARTFARVTLITAVQLNASKKTMRTAVVTGEMPKLKNPPDIGGPYRKPSDKDCT